MIRLLLLSLILSACVALNSKEDPPVPIEPEAPVETRQSGIATQEKVTKPKPVKPAPAPKVETVKTICVPISQNEKERFLQALDCLIEAEKPAKPKGE